VIVRSFVAVLGLLALPALAFAGPPGFAFLEVPAGARGAGMGGAYSAVAQGADAVFWNPAGLASLEGAEVTATHLETFEHLRHDQFAIASRHLGGALAASVRALYSEPIDERDDLGNVTGSFGSHDLEFQLAYGHRMGNAASWGLATQVLRERLANEGATTWGVSGGAAWQPAVVHGSRLSLDVQHLGPSAHYTFDGARGAPVRQPTSLDAAASLAHSTGGRLTVTGAAETRLVRGRSALVALGAELESSVGAALRAGYRIGDDVSTVTFGAGWHGGPLRVDYAFAPSRLNLDDTHRFSFGARF